MDPYYDILITGGTLLTLAIPGEIVEKPTIGIRDGRISFVEKGRLPDGFAPKAREVIDATGSIIMPGLVNVHTHLPMVLFRGLADDLPLMEWLNGHIFPAEGRFMNRDSVYTGATLAMAEMILSGTTTFCDGYFFEGAVARATLDCGMRGVVAQGFIDFPTPDQPDTSKNREIAEKFVRKWLGVSPLIVPSLVCHSPYTCTPATLRTIKEIAGAAGITFQIHLSETQEEVALILARYGRRPVHHLDDLGLLDGGTLAAHCIWLDEEELDLLALHDVKVAHDPKSNMKLGVGIAPVPAMLRRGIDVGLATDGAASNNNLDLFGEMGMCAKLHKAFSLDPTILPAQKVVEMATMGGARALGMDGMIGSIVPGKCADIIILDLNKPHLTPLYDPFSQLVYAASGADVTTTIIGGRIVMKNRHLLTMNVDHAMAEARKIAQEVISAGYFHPPRQGAMTSSGSIRT